VISLLRRLDERAANPWLHWRGNSMLAESPRCNF